MIDNAESQFADKFILHLKLEKTSLTVSYGSSMRQSTHKTCFKELEVTKESPHSYLGITARNNDRYVKDLEVIAIKVTNLDPNFYRHEGED